MKLLLQQIVSRLVCALAAFSLLAPAGSLPAAMAHDNEPVGAYGEVIPVSALGKNAIGLEVQTVHKTSLPMEISVPGKIEVIPTRQFDQHAPLSGRIAKVDVWPGEQVKEGQVLAIIDSPEMNQLAAQLLQSKVDTESEYDRQQASLDEEVRDAEQRLTLADANRSRLKKLYQEKIAAQKDVLAANSEYDVAQIRVRTAKENRQIVLKALKAKIELVQNPLRQRLKMLGVDKDDIESMVHNQTTLTSVPVEAARSGVITAIAASPGKSIDPSVSLFTIADLSKVWATAEVYEDDMSRMKVGENVHVKVHALSGEHVNGALTFIGSQVDPQTRTLPVRAELDNPELKLKPDMFAELYIQTSESQPMIAVPRDAVVQRTGHYVAFLETPEGYQPVYVKVGRNVGDSVEITEGLKEGERVVVRGAFQLGAQLTKNQGGEALFASPTEGEHVDSDEKDKAGNVLSLNLQTVLVIVAGAFLLGFCISAVFLVRRNNQNQADDSRNLNNSAHLRKAPSAIAPAPNELPVITPHDTAKQASETAASPNTPES